MDTVDTSPLYQWKNSCRLCLLEDGIKLPIFEEEGIERQVSHKIQSCFPIVIYETDPLPKMICHKCLFKLDIVFEFRLKSMDVNSILLRHIEPYRDHSDVKKYFATVRANLKTQVSRKQLQAKKRRNANEHRVSLPDEAKADGGQVKCVRKSTEQTERGESVLTSADNTTTVLSGATIGAHGTRVTRSGNVSGGAGSCPNAAHVFQEVFLNEASSDGFLPEQPSGDGLQQIQDVHTQDASGAAQKRREEEKFHVMEVDMIKKEPGVVEESLLLQFEIAKGTVAQPVLKLAVNSSLAVDSENQNNALPTPKLITIKKFLCKTCNFRSTDKLEMREHLCAFQTSYSCKVCHKYFYNKALLNKHESRSTCALSFKKCPQCTASFSSLEALAEHQAVHFKVIACTKEEDLHSCECGKRFVCKLMLAVHKKMHKVINGKSLRVCDKECKFKCDICGKGFNDLEDCKNHKRVHNFCSKLKKSFDHEIPSSQASHAQSINLKCNDCGKVLCHHGAYTNHMKMHSRAQDGKSCEGVDKLPLAEGEAKSLGLKCKQCDAMFGSRSAWLIHKRQHCASGKVKKRATLDNSNISNTMSASGAEPAANQQVHSGMNNTEIPTAHPVIGIFKCPTCRKSFSSKEGKLLHQKIHAPGYKNCFPCRVCEKKLLNRGGYVAHMKTHKYVPCGTCRDMFEDEQALRVHSCGDGTSVGTLPVFKCSLCPDVFPSLQDRDAHEKAHKTGADASSSVVSEVLQPLDMNHSNKKQGLSKTRDGYKCNICGKHTVSLHGGKLHLKKHFIKSQQISKRNFKCPFCDRGFVSLNATYDHIAINHPEVRAR